MKNILLIGGSSGIGAAIHEQLQPDYNIIAISRSTSPAYDATKDALPETPDELHGLIYCPGSILLKPFHRITDEEFINDFSINVIGAVRSIRAALPKLKQAGNASIILFSTVAVAQGMPFHASVAAAKGAVEGLAKSLAAELAPAIRVNVIAPSLTDTPLASKLLASDEKRKAAADRHPLKMVGDAVDMAEIVRFLISDHAKWISGQVIHADGGVSSLRP